MPFGGGVGEGMDVVGEGDEIVTIVSVIALTPPYITTLPTEIHLQIISYIYNTDITLLGLTCKKFYLIY